MTKTSTAAAPMVTTLIKAEEAPIGVQLWPTRSPLYAPNFTLASVSVVRTATGSHVVWTYESGTTRVFALGEDVACEL
jgi:hypothetical protein